MNQRAMLSSRPVEILLVEDNPGDVDLTREALKEWRIVNELVVVEDGVAALEFLRGEGKYKNAPRPDLILLDLNLPKKDGREVLAEIKGDRYLKTIPVVVLSTSEADMDVIKSYGLGANCYITKPIGIDPFMNVIETVGDFWFSIVKLPSRHLLQDYREKLITAAAGSSAEPGRKESIRVLVIDDNQADRDLVSEILARAKDRRYVVSSCDRLAEAIQCMGRDRADVVMLDLGLPDSTGIDTYRRLTQHFPHVPIVIATGIDDSELALQAIRAGAQDFISKGDLDSRLLSRVLQYAIERKWADEERGTLLLREREARAAAEEAIFARDEFLSIASHELKTPVTSLLMQSQLLLQMADQDLRDAEKKKQKRLLNGLVGQAQRLAKLIENLLDISRIHAGRLQLEIHEVDLTELVGDLLERFTTDLQEARCAVSFHGDPGAIGRWDRFRVEQVITNLLSNAMKFGAGKPIEVEVKKEADFAVVTVRDHGIGIKQEDLSRLFARFSRVVRPSEFSGLGLGLYISRQIIDAHRGNIRVESEIGRGTTFKVELPLRPALTQEAA